MYISCILKAKFFVNGAIKSATLLAHAVLAAVNNNSRDVNKTFLQDQDLLFQDRDQDQDFKNIPRPTPRPCLFGQDQDPVTFTQCQIN